MKKAILIAFIDDATRRIVYSSFTHTERSYEFEKGIKHILKTHGHIGKLYTDYTEKKQMPKFACIYFPGREITLKTSA